MLQETQLPLQHQHVIQTQLGPIHGVLIPHHVRHALQQHQIHQITQLIIQTIHMDS